MPVKTRCGPRCVRTVARKHCQQALPEVAGAGVRTALPARLRARGGSACVCAECPRGAPHMAWLRVEQLSNCEGSAAAGQRGGGPARRRRAAWRAGPRARVQALGMEVTVISTSPHKAAACALTRAAARVRAGAGHGGDRDQHQPAQGEGGARAPGRRQLHRVQRRQADGGARPHPRALGLPAMPSARGWELTIIWVLRIQRVYNLVRVIVCCCVAVSAQAAGARKCHALRQAWRC